MRASDLGVTARQNIKNGFAPGYDINVLFEGWPTAGRQSLLISRMRLRALLAERRGLFVLESERKKPPRVQVLMNQSFARLMRNDAISVKAFWISAFLGLSMYGVPESLSFCSAMSSGIEVMSGSLTSSHISLV